MNWDWVEEDYRYEGLRYLIHSCTKITVKINVITWGRTGGKGGHMTAFKEGQILGHYLKYWIKIKTPDIAIHPPTFLSVHPSESGLIRKRPGGWFTFRRSANIKVKAVLRCPGRRRTCWWPIVIPGRGWLSLGRRLEERGLPLDKTSSWANT